MGNRRKKRGDGGQLAVARQPVILEGREMVDSRPSASLGITHVAEFELRKGPIPDADELARYGQAHPDAPVVILNEFENQAAHRRRLECRAQLLDRKALEASIMSERIGVVCALLIALVGFGCATFLVATGHGGEGTVIFGLDVGELVSAFILGRTRVAAEAGADR